MKILCGKISFLIKDADHRTASLLNMSFFDGCFSNILSPKTWLSGILTLHGLNKFPNHSNINAWDLLITELFYMSVSWPQLFCSSLIKSKRNIMMRDYFLNKIFDSIYFYLKNVVTTKGWLRWKMCCIYSYALLFILPQLVCLAVQIFCYRFITLFQKLVRLYLGNIAQRLQTISAT